MKRILILFVAFGTLSLLAYGQSKEKAAEKTYEQESIFPSMTSIILKVTPVVNVGFNNNPVFAVGSQKTL